MRHILFSLIFLSAAAPAWALPIENCRNENKNYQHELNLTLDELEKTYVQYRWTEALIRRTYYDNLWEARRLGNDPLDAGKREKGQDLEKKYKELLKPLLLESGKLSNGFVQTLEKMKPSDRQTSALCERRDVQTCVILAYGPFYEMLDQGREIFSRIFENERDYRINVENASGGRDGLYPEDALEPSGEHTDFYWRFEQPKNQARFEEDGEIMRLIMAARHFLQLEDAGESCCRECI